MLITDLDFIECETIMKLLIPTEPDDTHAILVKLALENEGHPVRLLFTADQPTKQKNTVFINEGSYHWKSSDRHFSIADNDYDVVWWRRARRPYLPKNSVHPSDYKFVTRENSLFYESLTDNLAPNAWWVNSKIAANRANSKLLQLKIASDCGMKIPITICSNDPQDIRYFVLKHEKDGVIYKPLCSNFWFEERRIKVSHTSKIDFLTLPENKLLQLSPGIFQKEIQKKHELRITCFGDYMVAAKLDSQEHPDGKVDWRAIPEGKMSIEPVGLPAHLMSQIRTFMHKMGLVFGSLDFIVTHDNEYIFLEVNEQGQFLWIEEYNNEFKMLDIFINFLLNLSPQFQWNEKTQIHAIDHYRDKMAEMLNTNMKNHVDRNSAKAYNE